MIGNTSKTLKLWWTTVCLTAWLFAWTDVFTFLRSIVCGDVCRGALIFPVGKIGVVFGNITVGGREVPWVEKSLEPSSRQNSREKINEIATRPDAGKSVWWYDFRVNLTYASQYQIIIDSVQQLFCRGRLHSNKTDKEYQDIGRAQNNICSLNVII